LLQQDKILELSTFARSKPSTFARSATLFFSPRCFAREEMFLREVGIQMSWRLDPTVVRAAGVAWATHMAARRKGGANSPKRPIADVLIGALALKHDGLVTRNEKDFKRRFPGLRIVVPE
jgi:predicted nucleic acid-binding protein